MSAGSDYVVGNPAWREILADVPVANFAGVDTHYTLQWFSGMVILGGANARLAATFGANTIATANTAGNLKPEDTKTEDGYLILGTGDPNGRCVRFESTRHTDSLAKFLSSVRCAPCLRRSTLFGRHKVIVTPHLTGWTTAYWDHGKINNPYSMA
ncbi:hypothetical protein PHLCEN_2v8053 [Hermanssonia centrifuga]|uniref:Uncharacterized protein n=1 Tax=Hermanssonia centrifuga TaxID=98765 RepID=A0A2R6NUT9_9APHY|nr:hypothetical protein PHLCEN_2v8053 [Hermanssonia centrifuga]